MAPEKVIINAGEIGASETLPTSTPEPTAPSPVAEALSKMATLEGVPTTPEPEPTPEPTEEAPTEEELEVYGSEAEWLKAKGIEGYDSIEAYKSASEGPFQQLKQIMGSYGFRTEAKNLIELNQQLVEELVKVQNAPPEKAATAPLPTIDLTEFYKRYGEQIDDGQKTFYSDLANAVAGHSQKPLGEVQSRLQVLQELNELMLARDWYNNAKSQAGDDPAPSFAEALALLNSTPQARDSALFRLMRFGDTTANPMSQVFNVWRAGHVPGGLSKAEAVKRNTAAKKIAIMKGMLKSTPETRPTTKLRTLEETATFLDGVDFENLK